jgi:hypothetical protein
MSLIAPPKCEAKKGMKLLVAIAALVGFLPARAALQFTNVHSGGASLAAAAYDGNSTFVAVGTNSTVVVGTYGTNFIWNITNVPGSVSLLSATYGAGRFLAGGPNAAVFYSTDGVRWYQTNYAWRNAGSVQAMAFSPIDGGRFVAASSFPQIAFADASLNWVSASLLIPIWDLESFRGATALGGSGYATCGIFGVIRTSADGIDWSVNRWLDITEPYLFGITSDGGQKVVAVGAGGRILLSMNGGVDWFAQASQTSTTLNAVAYSGSEFIAVGDAGTILTSGDGASWANWGSIGATNLNGIVFATAGNLQGVGLVVGSGGTVYLAGHPPEAPINPVNQTNCAFSLPNPSLAVTVVTSTVNPLVVVDWYDAGGKQVTNSSATYRPTNTAPGTYFYYAEQRDLRTGITSSSRTNRTKVIFRVNTRPLAPTSPSSQIGCFGLTNQPLSVVLGEGESANWYTEESGGLVVHSGLPVYNPPNPSAGTNRYYVAAVNDFTKCESTNRVEVDLILELWPCTNFLSITLVDTNAVVYWYGNYVLESSTNLGPLDWTLAAQGLGGTSNYFTNSGLAVPTSTFYRLYAPAD